MKRMAALGLLFCFLSPSLFACGTTDGGGPTRQTRVTTGKTPAEPTATATASATDPAPSGTTAGTSTVADPTTVPTDASTDATTTDRWDPVALALLGLDEEDRTVLIEVDRSATRWSDDRAAVLVTGPDEIAPATPTAERLIYERNRALETRLGITVEYAYRTDLPGEQAAKIVTLVNGGAADAPDLFIDALSDLVRAAFEGCFADILTRSGSYLDLGAEGWMTDLISGASLSRDRAYILAGDAFPDLYRGATVLPFNAGMLDGEQERLSSAILGEGKTLASGEKLSDRFFDLVAAGKWTYDTLAALSAAVWLDCGATADRDDTGDLLGVVYDVASDTASGAFLAGCGTDYLLATTEQGSGRVALTYRADAGSIGELFDALATLTAGNGTLVTMGGFAETAGEPGLNTHRDLFRRGYTLFAGPAPLGTLGLSEYRWMNDPISVVPVPKLHGSDRYVSRVSPDADAGAIRRTASAFSAVTAYLQYCAENSRDAVDAYLAYLTKTDTGPNAGTDEMLSVLRGSLSAGFGSILDGMVSGSGAPTWNALLESDAFLSGATKFAPAYADAIGVKQERLDRLLDAWYELPKGGATE